MPGIDSASRTAIASSQLTTTNLTAGGTYTGETVDGGSEPQVWPTRIRPIVRHLTATPVHGYLVLEESPDNFTTTIETRRKAIPADGQFRTFDWPVHLRYHRLKFINGNQAQTAMHVSSTTYRGEGSSLDEHDVLRFVLSTTNLDAAGVFTSQSFDIGPNGTTYLVHAAARSDKPSESGGFRIHWSDDGITWFADLAAVVTYAPEKIVQLESKPIARYVRVAYTNGATAQGSFRLWLALVTL